MNPRDEQKTPRFAIVNLEARVAPSITTFHLNGGGHTPSGSANGVPTVSANPAGHLPPGQN